MDNLPSIFGQHDLFDLEDLPEASDDFSRFLFNVRDRFGVDDIAYAGMNPVNGSIFGHVTYNDDWKAHYASQGYHKIDPTLHKARRSIAPVDWARLDRDSNFLMVFDDARDFGIRDQGLTIPVRGPYGDVGGLSVTSSLSQKEWNKLKGEVLVGLQSVAVHVHDMVIRSDNLSNLLRTPTLSHRELEALQWTSAGKSQQDIADILSISNRTVEVHLRSARHKLYALTTAQAVGRAISMGLIYPG
ncbi:autoinducer binding domain-containing protein [uncultured Roseovarius sp.]|uniref:autoinducer binding domain-containing protein n=1 Tax=uncultured Roseovarius sp. TaxID=293344 RepID=UPI00261ABFA7|nr:autoinducer binding domain-containing protein [uncultured Roseovarius sp.]